MAGSNSTYTAVGNAALKAATCRTRQKPKSRSCLTLVYDRKANDCASKSLRTAQVDQARLAHNRKQGKHAVSISLNAKVFLRVIVIAAIALCFSSAIEGVRAMKINHTLDSARVEEVRAVTGDTLWSIAEQCGGSDVPTEDVVNWIRSRNNLNSAMIKPGQRISVPVVV